MKTILHVENSPTVRIALRSFLKKRIPEMDYIEARSIADAKMALVMLRDVSIDFVILDWSLPDGTAIELEDDLAARGLRRVIVTARPKDVDSGLVPESAVLDKADPNWMAKVVRRILG